MSIWFFEDVDVDHGALTHLQDVALATATRLQEAAQRRPRIAARNLARCAGPFAEDLADQVIRLANHHLELAEALVTLAATAASAARDAHFEQARREQLRRDHQAYQAAEVLGNAAAGALTATFSAPSMAAVMTGAAAAATTTGFASAPGGNAWHPGAPL